MVNKLFILNNDISKFYHDSIYRYFLFIIINLLLLLLT